MLDKKFIEVLNGTPLKGSYYHLYMRRKEDTKFSLWGTYIDKEEVVEEAQKHEHDHVIKVVLHTIKLEELGWFD